MLQVKLKYLLLLFVSGFVWSGSNTDVQNTLAPERIIKFAKDIEKYAASQGAHAFIISRVGRPENALPKGIKYTHTAIAVYSNITLDDDEVVQGYAIHNLYQNSDDLSKSQLVMDFPVDFFWGVNTLKAGIVIPTPNIQLRLIELIEQGQNHELHNKNYSVISNPLNSKLQNCTEHTLDMLQAAIYQTLDVKQIKANSRAYFKPHELGTSRFKLMFGSWFMDDVTLADHSGKVATTTFTSIYQYLDKYKLTKHAVDFMEDSQTLTL